MPALYYLTVQDMLWINHRVTGKVLPFRYDFLEEATFFQYGYGQSMDVAEQASRFLAGFPRKSPFPEGNEATALVGCLAFLEANGKKGSVDETAARSWMTSGGEAPRLRIGDGATIHGQPDIRAIIEEVLHEYSGALTLSQRESLAPGANRR